MLKLWCVWACSYSLYALFEICTGCNEFLRRSKNVQQCPWHTVLFYLHKCFQGIFYSNVECNCVHIIVICDYVNFKKHHEKYIRFNFYLFRKLRCLWYVYNMLWPLAVTKISPCFIVKFYCIIDNEKAQIF